WFLVRPLVPLVLCPVSLRGRRAGRVRPSTKDQVRTTALELSTKDPKVRGAGYSTMKNAIAPAAKWSSADSENLLDGVDWPVSMVLPNTDREQAIEERRTSERPSRSRAACGNSGSIREWIATGLRRLGPPQGPKVNTY